MSNSMIDLLIEPKPRDLGEFSVRRTLPDRRRQRVGPFIFFDHMGPADFPPGKGVNVRSHPHIGLATVTYLFDGEILHRDSLGYVQPIRPGEVNWMTAGRGIVHSEKVTDEVLASGQHLHGLQIWVALPVEKEEIEPRFEHYTAGDIPAVERDDATITIIIGEAFGRASPVRTESTTIYAAVEAQEGASVELPEAEELAVYVVDGDVDIAGNSIGGGVMAILSDRRDAPVIAKSPSRFMFAGGDRLEGDREIWWNFVSSSPKLMAAAKEAWKSGQFDEVPGETDFIPLPEG
ncbi:MAG: pirin family protein [Woeseiaceae bacterium]|nr:pirin family protein [Woeseiaceae bacterium]